jgi:hypothetical protein
MEKTVYVEFIGGPYDQLTISTKSEIEDQAAFAEFLFLATDNGTVGKRTVGMSPYGTKTKRAFQFGPEGAPKDFAVQAHIYEVTERIEERNEILIRLKYVGVSPKPASDAPGDAGK